MTRHLTPPLPAPTQPDPRSTEFDGYDDDETVRVVLSGNQVPKAVEITQEGIDAGAEVGQAAVLGAQGRVCHRARRAEALGV